MSIHDSPVFFLTDIHTAYPASATVTVVSTLITTRLPPSGSLAPGSGSTGSGSLCFTCFLTPTVVTGGGTYESPPVNTATTGVCSAPQASGSVGTTTVFTTEYVTACPTPGMCPPEGFGWYGTLFGSNFSSFSVAPQSSFVSANEGMGPFAGGSPTSTIVVTSSAPSNGASAVPICPASDGRIFMDSLGQVYEIGCGRVVTDQTISTSNVSSLASCIDACDMYNLRSFNSPSSCLAVSFYSALTSGKCELKNGYTNVTDPDADSACLVSRSAGSGNGTTGNGGSGGNGDYGSGSVVGTFTATAPGSGGVTTVLAGGVTTVIGGSGGSGPGNGAETGPGTGAGTGPGTGAGTGPGTGPGTGAGTGPGTGAGTGPGSTVYAVSTAVSTIVSNGQTILSTYGVSTAVGVVYQPASTRTVTTTTVSISISVSERTVVSTAPGTTISVGGGTGGGGQVVTITAGGGNYITVTQVVTSYAVPSSHSSSFTCRTYATNYLNGMHGRKLARKRSVFEKYGMGGEDPLAPMPGPSP